MGAVEAGRELISVAKLMARYRTTNGPRAPSPDSVLKTARARLLRVSFVNPLTNGHCAPVSIQYVCYNNYIVTCRCARVPHRRRCVGVRLHFFFHRQNRIVINYILFAGEMVLFFSRPLRNFVRDNTTSSFSSHA